MNPESKTKSSRRQSLLEVPKFFQSHSTPAPHGTSARGTGTGTAIPHAGEDTALSGVKSLGQAHAGW